MKTNLKAKSTIPCSAVHYLWKLPSKDGK